MPTFNELKDALARTDVGYETSIGETDVTNTDYAVLLDDNDQIKLALITDLVGDGDITIGIDGTGYDVQFFGDTPGSYMLWDQSEDQLAFVGGTGIDLDLEYDLSATATYAKSIYSVQTLTGEDGSDAGGLQGIRSDTNNSTYDNLWQVSLQGRATATGTAKVGDTIGCYASIKTVGALTRQNTTDSLVAFKGDVSDSPGSAWNANVHGVMIGYASQINYGGQTSCFFGYTHSTAYCDYGLMLKNLSPNMSSFIYLLNEASTAAVTTAIHIDNDDTMTNAFKIDGTISILMDLDDLAGDCVATGGTDCTASAGTDPGYVLKLTMPDGGAGYIRVWDTA